MSWYAAFDNCIATAPDGATGRLLHIPDQNTYDWVHGTFGKDYWVGLRAVKLEAYWHLDKDTPQTNVIDGFIPKGFVEPAEPGCYLTDQGGKVKIENDCDKTAKYICEIPGVRSKRI